MFIRLKYSFIRLNYHRLGKNIDRRSVNLQKNIVFIIHNRPDLALYLFTNKVYTLVKKSNDFYFQQLFFFFLSKRQTKTKNKENYKVK